MSPTLQEALRTPLSIQRTLWIAYTASVGIYWLVISITRSRPIMRPLPQLIEIACYVGACGAAIAFLLYRRRIFSAQYFAGLAPNEVNPITLATDVRRGVVNEDFLRRIEMLGDSDRRFLAAFHAMQSPLIIALALSGLIAILGLILAYNKHDPDVYLPFGVVAVSLNCLVWPTPHRFEMPGRTMHASGPA
jgi:hypothetical protein